MPSVLLVTQDLQRAGAQRQCVELALGLHERTSWEVEIGVLEGGDGPLAAELAAAGIPLHIWNRRWRWDLNPAGQIAAWTRARRTEVVHSFLFLPNFYARMARLRHRPPLLVSSLRSTGISGWPRQIAEVVMSPLCDVVIANSEAGRNDMVSHGVSPSRIEVVRNGLNLERFLSAGQSSARRATGDRWIGMVAQLEPRKDQLSLLDALVGIRARHPEVRLILAGDGRMRRRVEERIRQASLQSAVQLLGTVAHPEAIYADLDIYVQASATEEGTSNSIVEAMACGRPVVATDVGGNREIVEHGTTGLVVPPRDPAMLAAAVLELLEDPPRARRMGETARERARSRFSRDRMVEATIAIYEKRSRIRAERADRAVVRRRPT